MAAFLREGRGIVDPVEPVFSETEVDAAYRRLNECAAGVDGLTKRLLQPAAKLLLHEISSMFTHIYCKGCSISDWCLSIVVSIKKKGNSLVNMDNFRGIHLLNSFRQWYAMCLNPKLESLCAQLVPEEQQGFLKGRRIYASVLALYALCGKLSIAKEKIAHCIHRYQKSIPYCQSRFIVSKNVS